jgi:CheY-like chemotaxis protein
MMVSGRILVCDDEQDVCDTFEIVLKSSGYDVVKARSGTGLRELSTRLVELRMVLDEIRELLHQMAGGGPAGPRREPASGSHGDPDAPRGR